jgi:hypothetical protein
VAASVEVQIIGRSLLAEFSIRESREPLSNVTIERLPHPEKQFIQRTSTEAGMQMHWRWAHDANADSSIQES